MTQIYALKLGLRYGPYTDEELNQQLACGFFSKTNFVSCDNGHSWRTISEAEAQSRLSESQAMPSLHHAGE